MLKHMFGLSFCLQIISYGIQIVSNVKINKLNNDVRWKDEGPVNVCFILEVLDNILMQGFNWGLINNCCKNCTYQLNQTTQNKFYNFEKSLAQDFTHEKKCFVIWKYNFS